jgi:bifunctional non-homologous end joining protein LigD
LIEHPKVKAITMVRKAARRKMEKKRRAGDEIGGVRLTHSERVLYADQGITKGQLALCYEAIGDWILPQVENRPLTLLRCPEGYGKACFYQRQCAMLSTEEWLCLIPSSFLERPFLTA